jgi:hypothetical protein
LLVLISRFQEVITNYFTVDGRRKKNETVHKLGSGVIRRNPLFSKLPKLRMIPTVISVANTTSIHERGLEGGWLHGCT